MPPACSDDDRNQSTRLTRQQGWAYVMFMICSKSYVTEHAHEPDPDTEPPLIDPRHRPEAIAERILPADRRRGRGAATNATGRFELQKREDFDDGWTLEEAPEPWPPRSRGKSPRPSSRATRRPTLDSIARSIPIGVASTAAFIATPDRPTPIWGSRRARFRNQAVRQGRRR